MPYRSPEMQRAYQREWAQRRRAELLGAGAVCMKCGASDGLELHHLVKDEKVSHRITTWATARAKAEAAKCWILCGSCHRTLHADERRAVCGTASAYRAGCRCDACKEAHRVAARDGRRANRTLSARGTGFTARPGSPTPAAALTGDANTVLTADSTGEAVQPLFADESFASSSVSVLGHIEPPFPSSPLHDKGGREPTGSAPLEAVE